MKKLLLTIGIFALLFCSCDPHDKDSGKKFWAQNFKTGSFYQLDAKLLVTGAYCNIWAENGSGIGENTAQNMANVYDGQIYQTMLDAFDFKQTINFMGQSFSNTMKVADWLGDGDGKLCILLLDIKDNYQEGVNESYVSGYFWAGNLLITQYSNYCDMIYIDTNPGKPGSEQSNTTLAHEMQHMMNFVSTIIKRAKIEGNELKEIYPMDTWIDEGLSAAAEWVYLRRHSEDRWKWITEDESGLIKKGNNFFVWGNRENENQYAILDDYATVYLFFQWLRLQSNNDQGIYRDIIMSEKSDVDAVVDAAKKSIYSGYDWGTLLGDWHSANYTNSASGRNGYRGDPVLKNVKQPFAPGGSTLIELYPGEGVVSASPVSTPTDNGKIKYRNLTSALLTYNYDTNNKAAVPEEGTITGVSASVNTVSGSRSIITPKGPFPIGAGDVLRRNGYEELSINGFIIDAASENNGSPDE